MSYVPENHTKDKRETHTTEKEPQCILFHPPEGNETGGYLTWERNSEKRQKTERRKTWKKMCTVLAPTTQPGPQWHTPQERKPEKKVHETLSLRNHFTKRKKQKNKALLCLTFYLSDLAWTPMTSFQV